MTFLDETIIGVALPSIQRDLGLDGTEVQWVVNAYLLALAALVAVGGRLADIVNRNRLLIVATILFVGASVWAGLADDAPMLIAARAAQGAAAALLIPTSMALLVHAYPPEQRGRAIGLSTGIATVFLSLGPFVGGVLTEITWRLTFFINVPIAIAAVVLIIVARPDGSVEGGQRFDPAGAASLVAGLGAVVIALQQSSAWGWSSALTLGLLAFGVSALAIFVIVELRARDPLLDVRILTRPAFATDCGVLFATQAALVVLTVFGAIYVQDVLDLAPTEAGLSLLAITVPFLIVSPLGGVLYDRFGPRWLAFSGTMLAGFGLLATGALLGQDSVWLLLPGYAVLGAGLGLVFGPLYSDALGQAPSASRGEASGAAEAITQIGGTVGLAVLGTVITLTQRGRLEDFLRSEGAPGVGAREIEAALAAGDDGSGESAATAVLERLPAIATEAEQAFTDGLRLAYFIAAAVVIAAGLVAVLVLRSRPSQAHSP